VLKRALAAAVLIAAAGAQAQQPPPVGIAPVTLGSEPYVFDTAEQHKIKVSVLAKGFARPFAIEFLPDGDLLIVERGAGLRLLSGATGPSPALVGELVLGMPRPGEGPFSLGVQDIALHPQFATNHWLYFTYNDPAPRPEGDTRVPNQQFASFTLMRGKLVGGELSEVEALISGEAAPALGSRVAFGPDGKLYATTGGAFGESSQDLARSTARSCVSTTTARCRRTIPSSAARAPTRRSSATATATTTACWSIQRPARCSTPSTA
jgi:glucose/arabinose dehydrogenase